MHDSLDAELLQHLRFSTHLRAAARLPTLVRISVDRRMTAGKHGIPVWKKFATFRMLRKYGDDVTVSMYKLRSTVVDWMSLRNRELLPDMGCPKDHAVTKALEEAYTGLYGDKNRR